MNTFHWLPNTYYFVKSFGKSKKEPHSKIEKLTVTKKTRPYIIMKQPYNINKLNSLLTFSGIL
jgi:hypothetical protein